MNQDNLPLSMRCTAHDILYVRLSGTTLSGSRIRDKTEAQAQFVLRDGHDGFRSLITGLYFGRDGMPLAKEHLLPGELHQVNGKWVPVETVSFPSGTVATLSEGKVTGIQRDPEIVQGVGAVPEVQPLPYFTERTEFDPFKDCDFTVTSSTQAQPAAPVHPLQRDGAGAVFGSAYLLKD
jgi:hypothetical protein